MSHLTKGNEKGVKCNKKSKSQSIPKQNQKEAKANNETMFSMRYKTNAILERTCMQKIKKY